MSVSSSHQVPGIHTMPHQQAHRELRHKALSLALSAALASSGLGLVALPARAAPAQRTGDQVTTTQNSAPDAAKKGSKTKTLQTVIVTGSMIPTAQIETATPLIRLDAQDLQKQGYTSVYSALRAQPLAT
ncbi:MAG TPA: hypothetical protein VJN66_06775, partial [Rhodanobacteraceae bacterium]|nr:hypothetical protein [Rhodanobacteraceae bacterium]